MGLIRGMARTAVVAGTATAVSNRVSRRQYNRWAGQEQASYQQYEAQPAQQYAAQPAAPAPGPDGSDRIAQLKELADLKAQGALTAQEFEAEKARILAS